MRSFPPCKACCEATPARDTTPSRDATSAATRYLPAMRLFPAMRSLLAMRYFYSLRQPLCLLPSFSFALCGKGRNLRASTEKFSLYTFSNIS